MMIRQACAYLLVATGIFVFAGCSAWEGGYKERKQAEGIGNTPSKNLAGAYGDVGSDGSLKPRPAP